MKINNFEGLNGEGTVIIKATRKGWAVAGGRCKAGNWKEHMRMVKRLLKW